MTFSAHHHAGDGPPLVCLHGITDTWRTWELTLPALERHHEVFAPTLPGHAGGPPLDGELSDDSLLDGVERLLDEAGIEMAHIAGNSLGGYLALGLAARGRARSVVALAPAGGWAEGDESFRDTLQHFRTMRGLLEAAAPHADTIASTPDGRRRATAFITANHEHIPADLVAHIIRGAAACDAMVPLTDHAEQHGWRLDADKVGCPVRVVWGTADRILPWPGAAARYRATLPQADWVELEGIGHCPQLDVPLETVELILGFTGR